MSHHRRLRRSGIVFALAAIALSLAVGTATAAAPPHVALGLGKAVGSGVTKHFAFAAQQRSSVTLAANGYAAVVQDDPTGVFGDFALAGPVVCLRVVGSHAVIGITIQRSSGTAAGREGEAFYLIADDGGPTHTPDLFDNSGFTGTTTADCNHDQGPAGVVVQGDIRVR
jgi:hypothetical protein